MTKRRHQPAPTEKVPSADQPGRTKVARTAPATRSAGSYSPIGLSRKLARVVNLQRRVGNHAVQRVLAEQGGAGLAQVERMVLGPDIQADHAQSEQTANESATGEGDVYETQLSNTFSGAHWVTKYPAKTALGDLNSNFGNPLSRFLAALHKAGASITVKSTLWPKERVYLMHWAYRVARQGFDPQQVPEMDKVAIRWWHGTPERSRKAAEEMLKAFQIDKLEQSPSLKTHHADGQAVDMDVMWGGSLMLVDAHGQMHTIKSSPHDSTNDELLSVAQSYGLKMGGKHGDDGPPHWSVDGN
jgi:hypothetical protein